MNYLVSTAAVLGLMATTATNAAPVNMTGDLLSDVIFGTGNAQGSWTGATGGSIEVALRAKLRYDNNGDPQNVFNYDGDRTYTFDPSLSMVPLDRSVFNFEFSANSDTAAPGTLNRNVNDIVWNLTIDNDPSANINNVYNNDFINGFPFADHSFGNNMTGNGVGVEAADAAEYVNLRASNNVAQNSSNLGFGFSADPGAPGIYTFSLSGSDSLGNVLASTSIDVVVSAVPLSATLPMLLSPLALFGVMRKRRKS